VTQSGVANRHPEAAELAKEDGTVRSPFGPTRDTQAACHVAVVYWAADRSVATPPRGPRAGCRVTRELASDSSRFSPDDGPNRVGLRWTEDDDDDPDTAVSTTH
jgi:hypothetical protein